MGQIDELLSRVTDAWNRGDPTACAACYAEDASYISRAGELWSGRAAIERGHRSALEGPLKGTQVRITVRRETPVASSISVVHAGVELKGATSLWAVTTFIVRDGLIVAAHTSGI
jgi:uncharacterized protein (TIGR02246 family)